MLPESLFLMGMEVRVAYCYVSAFCYAVAALAIARRNADAVLIG